MGDLVARYALDDRFQLGITERAKVGALDRVAEGLKV
jgi:hypothetical protein